MKGNGNLVVYSVGVASTASLFTNIGPFENVGGAGLWRAWFGSKQRMDRVVNIEKIEKVAEFGRNRFSRYCSCTFRNR